MILKLGRGYTARVGKRTGNPVGRPPKPSGEHMERRLITFPPELWARLAARVPPYGRSRFVQEAVAEKLAREEESPAG